MGSTKKSHASTISAITPTKPYMITRELPGINIQWPWSELLLSGEKTVETRNYPLPKKYEGRELAIIETPGPAGHSRAGIKRGRIIGIIVFSGCFEYTNRSQWLRDQSRHKVTVADKFSFKSSAKKWGWVVHSVRSSPSITEAPYPRGRVFSGNCKVTN